MLKRSSGPFPILTMPVPAFQYHIPYEYAGGDEKSLQKHRLPVHDLPRNSTPVNPSTSRVLCPGLRLKCLDCKKWGILSIRIENISRLKNEIRLIRNNEMT
jgi:hypothetical protein